jgi:hypothetical protein
MPTKKSATVDRMDTPGKMYKSRILPLLVGVTLLLVMAGNAAGQAKDATSAGVFRSGASAQAQFRAASASWPLRFEENVGQVHGADARQVRFVSRGNAYTLFLTSTEAVLVLRQGAGHGKDAGKAAPVVARMRLSDANPAPHLAGRDELLGKSNYFLGNDPSQWHTGIPNYGRVTAAEVYPGVDLVYHGNQGQLEYDFEVAPQADPRKIRFVLEGIQGLRTDSRGDLLVKVAGGELQFRQPVAYQKEGGVERPVPVRYVLKGKNQVAFRLARYDKRQPLLIDPVLAYSTYLGGSNIDSGNGIAVAPDGTAFIAGGTFSDDFPTEHPLQSYAGNGDAFVAKISADGSTLLYSTYLGGKNYDVANGIAVDAAGEAFVTGTTNSPDFPVANGFDALCGGDGYCGATWNPQGFIVSNAFVTKLNVAGSALVYSSFLGYYENVQAHGIAVDGAENAYVTGETGPNIAPTVPILPPATPPPPFCTYHGFLTTFGGSGTDAFIVKIDASASELLYCSYLGGSDEDVGYGVAVDGSANAYVTGLTYSTDFPITAATALQAKYAGAGDAFLTKVNTNATGAASLVYSTYLGGTGLDQGNGIAVDSTGNAYLTGVTTSRASSLGFTPPTGAFQTDCALDSEGVCEGDAFVAKLNPTLSGSASLLYFTYLGGSLADSGTGIALDPSNNVYITGSTVSSNASLVPFPIAGTVFQPVFGGGNADAFVAELNLSNPPSTALVFSSYLGGSNTDTGSGIAVDTKGGAYVTGQTCSLDFPLSNPLQATPGGNCDAFVSKIVPSGGVELSPAGLIFPIQSLNSTSAPQTVTLTNGGSTALTITSIALAGADAADFSQTNTCDGSVAALGQCTFTVTFTPKAVGACIAQITITDNSPAPNSTQVVDLTGTGGNLPTVTLSATTLAFGNQAVNTTSSPLFLTVTNTGTATLNLTGAIASGNFAVQTNGCAVPLQATTPPSNCDIGVAFTPTSSGASIDSLTLTDNAPDSPQIILLTGTGVLQSAVSLSTSSLSFVEQIIGTTSAPQTVTVTNTGTAPLTFTSIVASTGFGDTSTCAAPVAPGGICTISVTFTPTGTGSAVGSITLTDNAGNSPQTIALVANGIAGPSVTLAPLSLTFATSLPVGTPSAPQTVTLSNTGSAALIIVGITASTNFAATNNCGASIPVGGNCSISVTFTPTAVGNLYGTLTVTDNNNGVLGSTQAVSLAGTGLAAPAVTLSASSLTFGNQTIGATSAPQSVTVTNSGSAALTFTSIVASAGFAETNTCGSPVAPNAICTISVTFTPSASGSAVGSVSLTDNGPGSPQAIILSGTGSLGPIVSLSDTNLTFGPQNVGTTSPAQGVTLSNAGSAPLEITGIVPTGDFAQTNTCPSTLAIGAICTINVTFTPTAAGNRYGNVTIADNAGNSPQTLILEGSGLAAPAVVLSASTLSFGSQAVNTTSAAQTVTVTNSGTATLNLGTITATGPFTQTNTCNSPVAAGGNCTISVTFTPTTTGSAVGSITLTDNAGNSPQTITLSGNGVPSPSVTLTPLSLTFATSLPVGTTSAAQTVTLSNVGSSSLLITSIAASGDFAAINNCPAGLAAGDNCTISVTFTPTAVGNRYGTLSVTDNNNGVPGSTQTVALEGTGLAAPGVTLSASSLTFGPQAAGTTSVAQTLTLTNSGTAALTITSIVITGGFSQTNTCPQSLAAGAACTFSVSFAPTVDGTLTGTLTITDNGPTSPQVVSLGGSGSDFGLAVAPITVTVVAGNSTNLTVTVNPLFGYNAQVTLACSGLPAAATCTASPSTLTPNGVSSLTSTLTIGTTQRTSMPPRGQHRPRGPGLPLRPEVWLMSALALFGLWSLVARKNRLRWASVALALTMLLLMGLAACGGGGTGYVDPTGTPAGTYKVTVNGSSGGLTHSVTVTLTVQ